MPKPGLVTITQEYGPKVAIQYATQDEYARTNSPEIVPEKPSVLLTELTPTDQRHGSVQPETGPMYRCLLRLPWT